MSSICNSGGADNPRIRCSADSPKRTSPTQGWGSGGDRVAPPRSRPTIGERWGQSGSASSRQPLARTRPRRRRDHPCSAAAARYGPTEAAVVRLRARDDVLDVSLGCAGEPRSGVRAVNDAAHVRNDVLAKGVRSLGPHQATIRAWLVADLSAPRKQRHTARRIWQRLVDERGATVAEATVRLRRPRAPRARVRQHRGDHPPAPCWCRRTRRTRTGGGCSASTTRSTA